jgi:hypothetical protein
MPPSIRTVDKKESKSNRYESLKFTRNPFPRKPSITINSSDDRENGSIYIPELRMEEIESFEKIAIPQKNGHETKNISFLMDHATRQGRGIGKTSFLNYQLKRINRDFGEEVSKGGEVLFAVYCSPIPGENYKKFWSFSKLIFRSIIEQNILSKAVCRIKVLSNLVPSEIINEVNDYNLLDTIGSSEWIRQKIEEKDLFDEFSETGLTHGIKRMLEQKGIDSLLAERLAKFGTSATEFLKHYFDILTESDWRKKGNDIVFNDLITILSEAGFTKGIILFDELEKIVQPQNSQDRRVFCEELRYWLIDGDNNSSKTSFFNVLLVIHPYIQELLNPHWSASGLERFSSLGGQFDDQSTIFFKPIKEEQAIPLAIEYMNASRINDAFKGEIFPFEKQALETALLKSFNVPGKFLSFLHQLIEKAIEENWDKINKDKVELLSITNQSKQNSDFDDTEPGYGIGNTKVTI